MVFTDDSNSLDPFCFGKQGFIFKKNETVHVAISTFVISVQLLFSFGGFVPATRCKFFFQRSKITKAGTHVCSHGKSYAKQEQSRPLGGLGSVRRRGNFIKHTKTIWATQQGLHCFQLVPQRAYQLPVRCRGSQPTAHAPNLAHCIEWFKWGIASLWSEKQSKIVNLSNIYIDFLFRANPLSYLLKTKSNEPSSVRGVSDVINLWRSLPCENFPEPIKCTRSYTCRFWMAYTCEQAFSSIKLIKSETRSRQTESNLKSYLLFSVTNLVPNI